MSPASVGPDPRKHCNPMQRRITSYLIPLAACVPALLSCGSDARDADAPPSTGSDMPGPIPAGEPESPDTPPATETPAAVDPSAPGASEEQPGDIVLDPTAPMQPSTPTTPGELTTP